MNIQSTDKTKKHRSAMEWMTRGLGVLVGFFSFEHGLLEALQGNTVPVIGPVGFDIKMLGFGYIIDAIGQNWKFWTGAMEPAFTVVPNYLITGISAMTIGIIIVLWALFMMKTKFGVPGFAGLTVLMFLFGGGFATVFTSLYTVICALLQNKEHRWWKTHIPLKTAWTIGRVWPWLFVFTLLSSFIAVSTAVFGYPFVWFLPDAVVGKLLVLIGNANSLLTIICILASIVHDTFKYARYPLVIYLNLSETQSHYL